MTGPAPSYSYEASIKSRASDELINTYLLRPLAGRIVHLLYPTAVTPDQVTLASIAAGIVAAALYLPGGWATTLAAGLCVTLKDLLDTADGQLARARRQYSTHGRFLDSLGDIGVNALIFTAIGASLLRATGDPLWCWAAAAGFAGTTLRVSYHVFYQVSYLHLHDAYTANRLQEDIRPEDRAGDPATFRLQRWFVALYGWQDRLMAALDRWSRAGLSTEGEAARAWLSDGTALRLSGLLGIGTELFLLMLFSVAHALQAYLIVNCCLLNGLWGACVVYRRAVLRRRISSAMAGRQLLRRS